MGLAVVAQHQGNIRPVPDLASVHFPLPAVDPQVPSDFNAIHPPPRMFAKLKSTVEDGSWLTDYLKPLVHKRWAAHVAYQRVRPRLDNNRLPIQCLGSSSFQRTAHMVKVNRGVSEEPLLHSCCAQLTTLK